jgi:hypothetical protein
MRNACRLLVKKLGERLLEGPGYRWQYGIKAYLREIVLEGSD